MSDDRLTTATPNAPSAEGETSTPVAARCDTRNAREAQMLRTLRIWAFGALLGAFVTAEWLIGEAERKLFAELATQRKGH